MANLAKNGKQKTSTIPKKQRTSLLKLGKQATNKTIDYISSFDENGHPIQLNYNGNETFQTFPGGFLSLIIKIILTCYSLLRFNAMLQKRDWSITQQTIVADMEKLEEKISFSEMKNISMALQMSPKREKVVDQKILDVLNQAAGGRRVLKEEDQYAWYVEMSQKYLIIEGMYELKNQTSITPLDTSVNPDSLTWKTYPTTIRENNFLLKEIAFEMKDVVLQGTADSIDYQDEALSRLQIRFNQTQAQIDAYRACKNGMFEKEIIKVQETKNEYYSMDSSGNFAFKPYLCKDTIESVSKTINKYIQHVYEDSSMYPNPEEQMEYVNQVANSDDQEFIDAFMMLFYQEHSFTRYVFLFQKILAWSNELIEVGIPQYVGIEFVKYATLGPDAYAVQRAQELANIQEQYPDTDLSCWVQDPNTFLTVFAGCAAEKIINPRDFRNIGYLSYMSKSAFEDIIYVYDEFKKVQALARVHGLVNNFYNNYINTEVFQKLDYDLVIYDEIEKFRDYNDPEFDYPYGSRKIKLDSYVFNSTSVVFDNADFINYVFNNYEYNQQVVKFQKSYVCLESHYLQVLIDFLPAIKNFFVEQTGIGEITPENDCGGQSFDKVKYSQTKQIQKNLEDDYGKGIIKDKIILEVVISLDQFQTTTFRKSTDFLELLGDVGGFQGALALFFGVVGAFFSSRMFTQDIANKFFIRALSKNELKKTSLKAIKKGKIDDLEKLKSMFQKINISFAQLFLDPIFNLLVPFSSCKNLPCRKRARILQKSQDKFTSQLDIMDLLNFMRDTSTMLAQFKDKEQKLLLRFAKNRTVKLSESDDSDSDQEKRHQLDSSQDSISDKEDIAETENEQSQIKDLFKKSVLKKLRIKSNLKDHLAEENIHSTKIAMKKCLQDSFAKHDGLYNTAQQILDLNSSHNRLQILTEEAKEKDEDEWNYDDDTNQQQMEGSGQQLYSDL